MILVKKKWLNTLLNKADSQITEVNISQDFVSTPMDNTFPSDFSDRLIPLSKPSGSTTTTTTRSSENFYGGPFTARLILFTRLMVKATLFPSLRKVAEQNGISVSRALYIR